MIRSIPIVNLAAICEAHHVAKLFLFGSIAREEFNPQSSDVDVSVIFLDVPIESYFDNYMALFSSLETLFGRSVDLVEYNAIQNPIFKAALDREKVILYDREAA